MAKNLLIVESPAKAKTIEKILGKDFEVKSCFGHIRDLQKEDMGVDIQNNFQPTYIIPQDKEKVAKELRSAAKKADEVWLASDEDREGESISWHLAELLNLNVDTTKRIVFHEITPKAIKNAVANPRTINMNLVNAQQARRVLDRLVGFELSPVLWKKIGNKTSLSAGRVQSVAVKLIVDREREINNFLTQSTFKINGRFVANTNNKKAQLKAEGVKEFKEIQSAKQFLETCFNAEYTITNIEVKPGKKQPSAPFTTSTLQQEASRKYSYSVSRTMSLAQKLYENGHITYMRTDSVSLSEQAQDDIKQVIVSQYGKNYYQKRHFQNKNESAQEAHEAIRPTYMENKTVGDSETQKLYDLIWKRTMASQMADAVLEKTIVTIEISTNHTNLIAQGEVIKFDGFLSVYFESTDESVDEDLEDDSKLLPPLHIGQKLDLQFLYAEEKFTKPGARYTEASLVKKMEELGIGRPSTYAPTISTITKRNYVEKKNKEGVERLRRRLKLNPKNIIEVDDIIEKTGVEKNKLIPTDLGLVVTDFLNTHFDIIMDFKFTAKIEEEFDEIALGKLKWHKMIDLFYRPFHDTIEKTIKTAERASGERLLGTDPKTGKVLVARMGRYGPMVQLGDSKDEDKAKFASLQTGQSIETISYDEAMMLFNLPRVIGNYEGDEVKINIGRFGPYALHQKKFYSLSKEMNAYTVGLPEIIDLINTKRTDAENKIILDFETEGIQVLNGIYGPYIKQGKSNYKLNKKLYPEPKNLNIETIQSIIAEQNQNPEKPKPKKFRKKA
ncbi:MAG: type I DNA topoisomerase [Alphaproteobacteria bacterium]|nr:type I DNA topoisomerase [Alphaproteobacteria bacterium]